MNANRFGITWLLFPLLITACFTWTPFGFAQLPPAADRFLWQHIDSTPQVRTLLRRYEALGARSRWLKQLPDPSATANLFLMPIETRLGPQQVAFSVAQPIPFPGYLGARAQVALHQAEALWWQYQQERINTYVEAGKMWLDLYYLRQEEAIVREHLQLLESILRTVRERVAGGLTTAEDHLRLQMQIEAYQTRLKIVERRQQALTEALHQVLALPPDVSLPGMDSLKVLITLPDSAQIADSILRTSALILRQEAIVAMRRAQQRVARLEGLPSFLAGASYFVIGEGGRDALAATVGVRLPLWRKKYREKVQEAHLQALADTFTLEAIQRRLLAELEMIWFGLQDARYRLTLYQELVELATHTRQMVLTAYAGGKEDFVEVLRIDRELLEYRLAYERALTDLHKNLLDLRKLLGR